MGTEFTPLPGTSVCSSRDFDPMHDANLAFCDLNTLRKRTQVVAANLHSICGVTAFCPEF